MAEQEPASQAAFPVSVALGPDERQLLERGKAQHRETTATAKRALQIAENTNDVARSTLVELHRQGQQLERADLGMKQVGQDVKEASAVLRFMRRWCCFQCCCDPTADLDRTRRSRASAAQKMLANQHSDVDQHYAAKQQSVQRKARQHDPAYGGNEHAARHELLAQADSIQAARQGTQATSIGFGLPETDRQEIQQETQRQDRVIDDIGNAVASLHTLSKEMHEEMEEQLPRIAHLQDRAEATHDELGSMMRDVRRI
ncbi:hypothetical protein D9Q98_009657 [Chlorella vulgaris]|uniref:t-SNARE coiled-coil homology domain-containing protein n=1 Tax=Chlorella vulgaris TaxID=3077 RepID=A0A9D4TET6_CHLVU|nr:hypothetical protein D9Q98_009657 [Chlorella vulgaris]